jgi:hypothetical protein
MPQCGSYGNVLKNFSAVHDARLGHLRKCADAANWQRTAETVLAAHSETLRLPIAVQKSAASIGRTTPHQPRCPIPPIITDPTTLFVDRDLAHGIARELNQFLERRFGVSLDIAVRPRFVKSSLVKPAQSHMETRVQARALEKIVNAARMNISEAYGSKQKPRVFIFFRISCWRVAMRTNIKLLTQLFAAVFGCATLAFGQQCGQNPGSVDKFKDNLARDGFLVTEGRAQKFDPVQNYCAGLLPNALYGNKGAPYVAALVPDSPPGEAPTPLPPEFRLAPDEAVVMIGLTPPSEHYFSYQIYLSHRLYPPKTQPDFLLNSLGDSVNLRTIQTIGPDPFKRPLVLVFTPDKDIEARVRDALRGADYPTSITNTVVIPSSMLKLGLSATSDTLLIAHRNALFTDPNASDLYIANPTLRVFRVTPKNTATSNPFPTPPPRVRGTGRTEMDLAPALVRLTKPF